MNPSFTIAPAHRDRRNPLLTLRANVVTGLLLILVAIIFVELLAWTVWPISNPGVLLLPLVVFATLIGGLKSGILAAASPLPTLFSSSTFPAQCGSTRCHRKDGRLFSQSPFLFR